MTDDEAREAFRGLVDRGILIVTVPHPDPLQAFYKFADPEGVADALAELEALGIPTAD